jgi:hypothetical protein
VGLGDRTGEREWKKREEGERSCCKGKRGKKENEEKEGKEEECGEGWNVGIEGRKIFPQSNHEFGSSPFTVKMRVQDMKRQLDLHFYTKSILFHLKRKESLFQSNQPHTCDMATNKTKTCSYFNTGL